MATPVENLKSGDVSASSEMLPKLFTIERVRKNTSDTFSIELLPKKQAHGCEFQPGQFNMLYVHGVGEVPISISGDVNDSPRLVHTVRAVGTVTHAMRSLKKGDMLGVRGPYGKPWPVKEAAGRDIVFVAGGIGLAPLRPALYYVLNNRDQYGKVVLLYGARTPKDILYRRELEKWRSRLDMYVDVTVDAARSDWHGNVGVATTLIPKADFDSQEAVAMLCGPEVMMRFTAQALQKSGMAMKDIYVSMERNMKCGIGLCGHCQMSHSFICKDGPVYSYDRVKQLMLTREI